MHRQPGRLARLLQKLRRQPETAADATQAATSYPHRAGAYLSRESAPGMPNVHQQHQDQPTQLLPINSGRLLTRAGEYRASFSLRNTGRYYR